MRVDPKSPKIESSTTRKGFCRLIWARQNPFCQFAILSAGSANLARTPAHDTWQQLIGEGQHSWARLRFTTSTPFCASISKGHARLSRSRLRCFGLSSASSLRRARGESRCCVHQSRGKHHASAKIPIADLTSSAIVQNRHVLLGLDTADVTASLAFNFHPAETFAEKSVSLHIIVPCIGRRSIFRLLLSLKSQLEPQVRSGLLRQ